MEIFWASGARILRDLTILGLLFVGYGLGYDRGVDHGRRTCTAPVSAYPLFREGEWVQVGLDAYAKRTEIGVAFHFDGTTMGVPMRDLRWLNLGIHPVGPPVALTPSEAPLVATTLDLDAVLPPTADPE